MSQAALSDLERRFAEIRDLENAGSILSWDQEVMMPSGGAAARSQTLATLAGVLHEKLSDAGLVDLVTKLGEGSDALAPHESRAVELVARSVREATAVPKQLAVEFARAKSQALEAWRSAREASDFALFRPALERNLGLAKEVAAAQSRGGDPYDAAIDLYEPGGTQAEFDPLLEELEALSRTLLERVLGSERTIDPSPMERNYGVEGQRRFVQRVIEAMGIDLGRGRLDLSTHPFCGGVGPGDVRMTGRYDEHDLRPGLYGAIHEAGHGLYEQGLDPERTRSPLGGAISMAIHESQSRLWENMIGRSQAFWTHWIGALRAEFSSATEGMDAGDLWRAANVMRPTPIRVEADELTYNLHIVLRYRIERELFAGSLEVRDLPERWNEGMRASLDLVPADDAHGCLQDIHWAMGSFGYFPTYSLGNLYAAQFLEAARRALPDLDALVARGELRPLQGWLREQIHRRDRLHTQAELTELVCGEPLSVAPFRRYLEQKVAELYG